MTEDPFEEERNQKNNPLTFFPGSSNIEISASRSKFSFDKGESPGLNKRSKGKLTEQFYLDKLDFEEEKEKRLKEKKNVSDKKY